LARQSKSRTRTLGYAERWLNDGLLISNQPAFHQSIEVDLSRVRAAINVARERGRRCTYVYVLVRSAALVFSANPDLHEMLAGNRVQSPSQVDIAISVGAKGAVVPTLVIQQAEEKSIYAIGEEIVRRVPEVTEAHDKMLSTLNQWGWLMPFAFLRRGVLRLLFRSFRFRRRGVGTFQISVVTEVDDFAIPLFNAAAILGGGAVKDRVIAIDGRPVVRPTIRLTCSADHRLWNGQDCQKFLLALRDVLTSEQLEREILNEPASEKFCKAQVP
jgi:pyruvate/2-oxoglutarate dehydrogenase complex dihydrolipoamide acyltransferase (E2) component